MKSLIDPAHLPKHIAVIMDGNGRWATKRGASRIFGHQNAIESVRAIIEGCVELGIPYLTLYAFSKENWGRPPKEIAGLMELLTTTLEGELDTLVKNELQLTVIGDISSLPKTCQAALQKATHACQHHKKMHLIIAISYSGRWEIVEAAKAIAQDVLKGVVTLDDMNERLFGDYLHTKGIPDPELLIRTSGEMRVSNFLLWQLAYTELFITDILWPEFRKKHLYEAIRAYQQRERRFGKTVKKA